MNRTVRVFPDAAALSKAVANESAQVIADCCEKKGRCTVALSGGRTPRGVYEMWARDFRERLPWAQIHLYWGDERYLSPDDPLSNFRMVREALLSHVPIPVENIHAMPTQYSNPDDAARAYEAILRESFEGEWPAFELIFLGAGLEGHAASLFPNAPALDEKDRWVVAVTAPAEPHQRLSFTLPVINHGRNVFILAAGAEKQEALRHALREPGAGSREWPVSLVRPTGRLVWFIDEAACGPQA